ncbi:MAG TPA: DUF4249 domain-containing protein [Cyclobacteriaceae bacterium]|nr:DUF4249 domain-containing protein [Cyclobacteriaceae bacterium]
MKRTLVHLVSLFVLIALGSCEKEYILRTNPADAKIVIEGLVTDKPGYQYVKISRSTDFYSSGKTPRVTDALVRVTDSDGVTTEFVHNPGAHPDSSGYYKPVAPFLGALGKTYSLVVIADGQEYRGEDTLYPVTTVDSLTYQINEDEQEDPEHPGRYYEVLIYTREPQETRDYYLFNFYRNDSLTLANPEDIYFTDDIVLAEAINGITMPIFFSQGDKATVEAFSISRQAFVFFNDLSILLNNDGGMYSPPPANCRNNLSNGALGFFRASAVTSMDIVVE